MPDKRRPRIPLQLNPFGEWALGSPWGEAPVDVPSIHEGPFRIIVSALSQIRLGGKGTSVVVTGEPGSGKTHLLGRLRKSLGPDATYIYVRCNASAATLWRHLRAAIAADLLKREDEAPSRLQSLLRGHPDRLDAVAGFGLRRALASYGEGRHVHAAAAWLRGEALPLADLEALGVGVEKDGIEYDGAERSRETEARDTVNGLLSFLGPAPTVLCFDQVEALETYRGDRDGFHAMGTLVAELYHEHSHLLMVSCIVSAFEPVFEELNNQANVARWLQHKVTLQPIDEDQAAELVKARLESSSELAPLRQMHAGEPLWPLDAGALTPLFANTGLCLPRALIEACRKQFESLLDDPAQRRPNLTRKEFLRREFSDALREARLNTRREGPEKTLSESLPWLLQNGGLTAVPRDDRRSRYSQFAFRTSGNDVAVALCCCGGNELTWKLRKIDRFWTTDPPSLRIVCDASVTPGARGQELIGILKQRGAQFVYPVPEAPAALQAIHNLVALARSGDLTHDGDTIGESEFAEWAQANLPPQLRKLRDDLAGLAVSEDSVLPRLAALLGERKVIDAGMAARELSLTLEEISACARRNPMRFGLLAGPPLVLFEAVEAPPGGGRATEGPRS
jgi:hypothetical protein